MEGTHYFVGIDGGGTRSRVAVADGEGWELARREGPAGLVDARLPAATAERLVELVAATLDSAGVEAPVAALCAGLAGVGNAAVRGAVQEIFERAGLATRVAIISDGEAALDGALGDRPGILLISGTGSVAHGRAEDGRVAECGGWGAHLGDEGSGFAIGRAGLQAILHATDGRGEETLLLDVLLHATGLDDVDALPPWMARAEKSDVAALAVHVLKSAREGDAAARAIVVEAALDLAAHVEALIRTLGPWGEPPRVALHGGVARDPAFQPHLERVLKALPSPLTIVPAAADAVAGALEHARRLEALTV